jgi:hypothetical protein
MVVVAVRIHVGQSGGLFVSVSPFLSPYSLGSNFVGPYSAGLHVVPALCSLRIVDLGLMGSLAGLGGLYDLGDIGDLVAHVGLYGRITS